MKIRTAQALASGRAWRASQRRNRGLMIGAGVNVVGWPRVRVVRGARIELADDVTLNSWAPGYHAGMYGPVILIADTVGASITVGVGSRLNGAVIHAQSSITIGDRVLMAAQATVLDSNGHALFPAENRATARDSPRPIIIGNDVWIGLGAVVLPGCRIGAGTVIGANCVVSEDVPAHSIVRQHSQTVPIERRRN